MMPTNNLKNPPILCCRIAWMGEYQSREERPYSHHRYILDGNTPYEALNFALGDDGLFRGYVPVGRDAEQVFGRINISRLGAARGAPQIDGITVIFCATNKDVGGLFVVGYYRNATVLRVPIVDEYENLPRVTRIISEEARLIPEPERIFPIPSNTANGFGRSNLWYGANKDEALRRALLSYVDDPEELPNGQKSVTEFRQRRQHKVWERRGNYRGFLEEKGCCCEACGYNITENEWRIWRSGFELHHLVPLSTLKEGETRKVTLSDFAVLCANCHRAIHNTPYVSDVETFREKVLTSRQFQFATKPS